MLGMRNYYKVDNIKLFKNEFLLNIMNVPKVTES